MHAVSLVVSLEFLLDTNARLLRPRGLYSHIFTLHVPRLRLILNALHQLLHLRLTHPLLYRLCVVCITIYIV